MSLMNQSITPSGHPSLFNTATGSASSQKLLWNLPVAPPPPLVHGQPGQLKSFHQSNNNLFMRNPLIRDVLGGGELDLFSSLEKLTGQKTALAVYVASAVVLENKQIELIAKKMRRVTGVRDLKLENTIDTSLIAGFIIRYEHEGLPQVIDLSIKGQLAELADQIESSEKRSSEQAQNWSLPN